MIKGVNMTISLYAGSFDPITYGHLDIIKTSASMFEKVIIAVGYNENKKSFIPVEKRLELINDCVKNIPTAEVCFYEGLTVDFAKKKNASVLIRGLRNPADFGFENELAQVNSKLNNNIHTVCLFAKPELACISSSAVREILANGGDLSGFVPQNVLDYLKTN